MSRVTKVRNTTRSCSTRLCFRLCSSDTGTDSVLPVRNTAVPSTRCGGCASSPAIKGSSGMPSSRLRARSSLRPLYQVISMKKAMLPSSSGNQPPSATLSRLAAKNDRSTSRKAAPTTTTSAVFHFHTLRMHTAARILVMTMVVVTAMP
ncbi:hypothetical protein D3C72_1498310 [compost metagenome]